MKYQYPMDVVWGSMEVEYTVSLSRDGVNIDAKGKDRMYPNTVTIREFEQLLDRGIVKIKPSKIEPITLQVQIEGLEKAVALAKELEEVLGRLKIVVN